MDRQRRNCLAHYDLRHSLSGLVHDTHDVPSRREWEGRFFRMNALPHQQVRERDASHELTHPHLASAWLWRLFLYGFQDLRPAKAANDDPERLHDSSLPFGFW